MDRVKRMKKSDKYFYSSVISVYVIMLFGNYQTLFPKWAFNIPSLGVFLILMWKSIKLAEKEDRVSVEEQTSKKDYGLILCVMVGTLYGVTSLFNLLGMPKWAGVVVWTVVGIIWVSKTSGWRK